MEILLVLQVIVVVALIAVILVQKSNSDGFTGGGAGANSFMTGRASANLFTRITSILAAIFIINSLVLAYIASHTERADSVVEQAAQESEAEKATNPDAQKKGGLNDLDKKIQGTKTLGNEKPAKAEKPETKSTVPTGKSSEAEGKPDVKTDEAPAEPVQEKPAAKSPSVPVSE